MQQTPEAKLQKIGELLEKLIKELNKILRMVE